MTTASLLPFPVFPSLECLKDVGSDKKVTPYYLEDRNLTDEQLRDLLLAQEFLLSYGMRSKETFNAYRSDIEALLLWTWLASGAESLSHIGRKDLARFFDFLHETPRDWIMSQRLRHFEGSSETLRANTDWRPFRVSPEEMENRSAKIRRSISHTSLLRMFSSLNVFFEFLIEEDHVVGNPVPSTKKRSPYMIKNTQAPKAHRLSGDAWDYTLDCLTAAADQDPSYERCLFAITLMKSCYLRISELSDRDHWSPTMGHFFKDRGFWWLTVFGKGRKIRDVTVPDDLLSYLTRYRLSRGLSNLPEKDERVPLIHKSKGQGNIGQRQLTRLIEEGFDLVVESLKSDGREEEAKEYAMATTHWLRHTGASIDVNTRPLKHLADDLGHATLSTTDRIYVQSDIIERGQTGKRRKV